MTTARDTYQISVKSAASTKAATLTLNEEVKQVTIDAANTVVGYGNNANLIAATTAAIKAKQAADFAAEVARQAAADAAREILRSTGDLAPL